MGRHVGGELVDVAAIDAVRALGRGAKALVLGVEHRALAPAAVRDQQVGLQPADADRWIGG
jgi:hypothetical protein